MNHFELSILGKKQTDIPSDTLKKVKLLPKFVLPQSYCDFVTQFGYGLLSNLLIIYVPMPGFGDDLSQRSKALMRVIKESIADDLFEYKPHGNRKLAERLVPFGISENGHILAWDPADNTAKDEYQLYAIGSKCLAIRKAGENLYSLIEQIQDKRVKKILGEGYEPLEPNFRPLKPKKLTK